MNDWFSIDLGDGITAFGPTQSIMEAFRAAYLEAGAPPQMAIFSRHDLTENVVTAYFTPESETLARSLGGKFCPKPVRDQDLCLLAGHADSFAIHFPQTETAGS
ncbi:MAG: hypothetical protein OJF52_003481 [Nitrospira sp.]|jgi:hypothetical protein|nr:MAG: hypothetical protein OJF52_003481 [Nitrospira sp.]